jgi:hypothetical protein
MIRSLLLDPQHCTILSTANTISRCRKSLLRGRVHHASLPSVGPPKTRCQSRRHDYFFERKKERKKTGQIFRITVSIVADPGCLSRILIFTHPGSRISDPKIVIPVPFFCSHKFHKIVNYFIFEMPKKKIWANFQRIIELFTQKIVTKLSKIWVWDPGSGKSYSGSRIQGSKRHRIPDPDPQH